MTDIGFDFHKDNQVMFEHKDESAIWLVVVWTCQQDVIGEGPRGYIYSAPYDHVIESATFFGKKIDRAAIVEIVGEDAVREVEKYKDSVEAEE